jgi:hypothetical protein
LQVAVSTSIKKDNAYRTLYKAPVFDYCKFMNGASDSPLFKSMTDQMVSDTNIFHKCPYGSGLIEVRNMDMKDDKFFSIYPPGTYQTIVKISSKDKVELLSLIFEANVTSLMRIG